MSMTGHQLKIARKALKLTQAKLAAALEISDGRAIRRYEARQGNIPGPVGVAVRLMIEQNQEARTRYNAATEEFMGIVNALSEAS